MTAAGSFSHVSLHVGAGFMVRCATYPNQTPILTIDAGDTSWSVTPDGRDATDDALAFARELARKAQEFANEVERMHAARHDGDGKAAKGKAA
jgi:hypothetical protein